MLSHQILFVGIEETVENQRNQHQYIAQKLGRLNKRICTKSELLFDGCKKPLVPTIIRPNIAAPHPTKCRFCITIPKRIFEKIAVVTILAPLNIKYVDPDMKFRPMY